MKGNLLIVDDEPALVKNLKSNLEDCADDIFTASNGREALEILELNDIHCIICDINMPVMNGVELIKKLRSQDNQVPFIFFTGHGNRELMFEAGKYGAFDFLNKPNFEGLEEIVSKGVELGVTKNAPEFDEAEIISEYQKILQEMRK